MFTKYLLISIFSLANCFKHNEMKTEVKNGIPSTEIVQPRRGAFRTIDGNRIIRTVDASQLPFTIGEEFTNENQEFVLVINNFKKPSVSAVISVNDKGRNLRINQIILPNNLTDGPFSNRMDYKTSRKGTYKIVVGKNLMKEGKLSGGFIISVK